MDGVCLRCQQGTLNYVWPTLSCHERLYHMAHQACLIIRSKSHEANVPYTEGKMRRNDGRSFPNSFMCCEETLQVVILTKHQGQSVLSRVFFAVIWLFPTSLPACPTILEAFGRSLQLWYESLKVFAAVSVVCNIRHIYLSTRHLVRDSASDCKYRDGWRRSMFCFSDCSWMYFYFLSPERALHCWLLPVCTIAIVLEW